MKFHGRVLILLKEPNGTVQSYKKSSKEPARVEQYKEYIESLEQHYGEALLKAYIVNKENGNYIWCNKAWRKDLNENISKNHLKYINFLSENKSDLKFIGPYRSMKAKSLHLCRYGHEWKVQPNKVVGGESCPRCKKKYKESNGAKFITELLVSNNIEFIKEVPISEFGHSEPLRLDFVICQNNYPLFATEYHGIQHYKKIRSEFFRGSQGYRDRKRRDTVKREYCWEIGLPLIEIPYSETEEQIEETIFYFLRLFELM